MRISDTVLTGVQNLGRRKVRTVLTSIGVFVGIMTIVTMVSLGVGIQQQITDTIKAFGLETVFITPRLEASLGGGSGSDGAGGGGFNPFMRQRPEKPITPADIQRIQHMQGVKSVEVIVSMPLIPEMTLTIDGRTFPVVLSDSSPQARIFTREIPMLAGQALSYTPEARGLVLTRRLLTRAGYSPEQLAGLVGKAVTITVTAPRGDRTTLQTRVVGVLDSASVMGSELGNADKLDLKKWWYNDPNILQTEGYSSAIVHTDTLNDATRVSKEIEDGMGFNASTLQVFLDQVNRIFSILQVMLSSVGLLALLVASIGIVNTMIMAIYERTREIGILKAVGASNGDVLRMFVVEAGLIGLLGGVAGLLAGWGLGLALNEVIREYFRQQQIPVSSAFFVVTWDLALGSLVFAALVGVLAGLYPAFRAARLDPLAALRHE